MALNIGYEFKNAALLEEALTTPSCKSTRPGIRDNQRLEFLGDAVLGLIAADRLFSLYPDADEGRLTVDRTHMVSSSALCRAAGRLNLAPLLRRNRGAPPLPENSKTIADAVEAIIGAAWLDGGLDAARAVFEALDLSPASVDEIDNPRGELQIRAQAMHPPRLPVYSLLKVTGRSDHPEFTVGVSVEGMGETTAVANNRRDAETKAAAKLLKTCLKECDHV